MQMLTKMFIDNANGKCEKVNGNVNINANGNFYNLMQVYNIKLLKAI